MTDSEERDDLPAPPPAPLDQASADRSAVVEAAAPEGEMTLLDHLEELRDTLLQSAVAAVVAAMGCWFVSAPLLDLLITPLSAAGEKVYFHGPIEAFMTRLKIAAVCGLFVVVPFILWRVYRFVMPGLYHKERRVVVPLVVASTGLFYAGVAFAYVILIPKVVVFMLSFGTENLMPLIGIDPYFAFVSRLCLAFGLVFELPLAVFMLSVLGLVQPRQLLAWWRYALVIIVIVSALLTPPDVLSQLLMAGPVMILYLGSVLVSMAVVRRKESAKSDED
ncbi:MAG TPA: twin-arginine translocase subunit TatC [Candidatus Krumholzibacteria bacterium]|nr:twin-arginine translocase subunit TatC [Candidatus Krumholzibacteria bacterium]HRX51094.1 twin-arginine translocase subunit TatC [Candidatus Krumholzibacteria bacterium]